MCHILGRALALFKERYPLVPLQGLVQNQMLVFRPEAIAQTAQFGNHSAPQGEKLVCIDNAESPTTRALATTTPRLPPGKGIPMRLATIK